MSRIGKLPIKIPANVDITCSGPDLTVKGKFGTLHNTIPDAIGIEEIDGSLIVNVKDNTRSNRALHGLYRTLINNMVTGVSEQFQLTLNLQGVGYRASVQGNSIILNLGYSHPVELVIPEGISVEVVQNTTINLKACDKGNLGLFASNIRSWRPPEPYKGKGILYKGEIVKRKAGKSGKK
uniref:Large ribosomal subunit protein uL6c n=1 Tax=Trieres chinensis TaxID=1514140 RepID=RK6_TRICV|nr:ribosomal protein L6 [Trieres chinensis]P49548.1 RecName: Full=Large ribosomal subunit protein uL6c; AltName: Full=50S ribosomal protein L6, chloroplastic [Trieres chinensis]CAA91634.1 50S ribosomal protein L6 [Trieres chinensis]